MPQMEFPFVKELDRQLADEKEAEAEHWRQVHAESHIKWCLESYPPTAEECDIMLMGIRLCRFVNSYKECQSCDLACEDHTVGWLFNTKICLKDYHRKCRDWGIKP